MVLERVNPALLPLFSSFHLAFLVVLLYVFSFSFWSIMAAETSTKSDSITSSDDSQNLSSPYYLHPGENSGMVLINVQLDGGNYHAWSRGMKRALLSKNKHKFVDGSILVSQSGLFLHEVWERCNMMVIS